MSARGGSGAAGATGGPLLAAVVRGDDPTLREEALHDLVEALLAGDDRSLAVEEHTVPRARRAGDGDGADGGTDGAGAAAAATGDEDAVLTAALTAAQSPPFLTARRVVVLRDVGALSAAGAERVTAYLADPVDTTTLVLVTGGGRVPAALTRALKGRAQEVGREREATGDVLARVAAERGVTLSAEAADAVAAHLGDDAGRVPELVDLLASTYGPGTRLEPGDVEPYLGEAGTAEAFALTNAIERGDVAGALAVLHRLLHATSGKQAKPWHPLQVTAMLVSSYQRLLRLDDPSVTTPAQAADLLGLKNPHAARYRLDAARRLGRAGLREAFGYLARADLDLRGARAIPEETTLEILVARLAALQGRRARSGRPARR